MRPSPFALPLLLLVAGGCSNEGPDPVAPAPATGADQASVEPGEPASPPAAPIVADPPAAPADAADSVPEPFRGRYASDAAACTRGGEESRLVIEADRIAFHESSGAVVGVTGDGAEAAITARLSGEGETWERTYRFRLEDGGRAIVDAEHGMRRIRCDAAG